MAEGLKALKEIKYMLDAPYTSSIIKEGFEIIEKELEEKKYLDHFLNTIFDIFFEDITLRTQYDKDLKKYEVYFSIDNGIEFHFYCSREEYLYWRKLSGVDDQYGPEDLK